MFTKVGIGTGPDGPVNQLQARINGMEVVITTAALEKTEVRNFPASKHRSKRILKKLIQRHGSEYRMEPAIYMAGNKLLVHPSLQQKFEELVQGRMIGAGT